jgi:hypothetical protein
LFRANTGSRLAAPLGGAVVKILDVVLTVAAAGIPKGWVFA